MNVAIHIPKNSRYTIGSRIENKFLDLLEQTYIAYFTSQETKVQKISTCILTLDTIKFLLHVAWEAKLVSHKHYAELGVKLEEIGKMLGGWKGQVIKKTSASIDGSKK